MTDIKDVSNAELRKQLLFMADGDMHPEDEAIVREAARRLTEGKDR